MLDTLHKYVLGATTGFMKDKGFNTDSKLIEAAIALAVVVVAAGAAMALSNSSSDASRKTPPF